MKKYRIKNLPSAIKILFFKYSLLIFAAVITAIALYIRLKVASYPTNDSVGYIVNNWMGQIDEVGFKNFYSIDADYSPLYLFIIALLCKLPKGELETINNTTFYVNRLIYLKSVYFIFDILLAIGIALIVYKTLNNKTTAFIAYYVTILLPVQYINSAIWGNCDVLYSSILVFALFSIIIQKDYVTYSLIGLALSLKLQAVFILPFIVYLIFNNKLRLYPIFMMFVVILLTFVPSYCCGASFTQPFTFYQKQLNGYSNLTLGCANFWHLVNMYNMDSSDSVINKFSTIIALAFIGLFFTILYLRRIKLTKENIIYVATFMIGIVPFFLPHMHERYFYIFEVLIVAYTLIKKKRYYLIPLTQLSGLIAYYHYTSGFSKYFIEVMGEDSVTIAAVINLFVLAFIFIDLLHLEQYSKEEFVESLKDRNYKTNKDTLTEGLEK